MTNPHPPLPLATTNWRSRWLVTDAGKSLHRISAMNWDAPDKISGYGIAVCGVQGNFHMPGIFSRMGAPRCAACCKALDIPEGKGAPFNQDAEWADA